MIRTGEFRIRCLQEKDNVVCGICGGLDARGFDRTALEKMAETLRHRGPDDEGFHTDGPLGLGFRRLSIIDLVHGNQPLANEDGSVRVVFNGEIYNFRQLRRELEAKGHQFATDTDTEVIVHLYEELGEDCVERLRGMFAFAVWDGQRDRLFLARDRLGQKPLFYWEEGDRFLFASEVKGILAHPSVDAELDATALHSYLALRFVPAPRSMFEGIRSLPPAHTMTVGSGGTRTRRYWDLSYRPKWSGSEDELTDRLEDRLRDSVQSHLVSDVPLGTFLSGGIDSGLMSALVSEEKGPGVPTFSIGSREESFNELPLARRAAENLGMDHHTEVVEPDIVSLLPRMVHHLDMPGDPIAACQYHVARLASEHVKVSVGGDGGDELFAGYDRFLGFDYVDYYAALPESLRRRLIGPLLDRLPDSAAYKSTVSKLRWLHEMSFRDGAERYAQTTTYFRFDQGRMDELYGPTLRSVLEDVDPRRSVVEAFGAADSDELLDRMLHADATTRLPEHLLILVDRMTMAHSLEGRLPMLDHHVAEFAARLPAEMKLRGHTLKYLLRKVAERHLPEEVTEAPKQGFMFPIAQWLKEDLRESSRRLLLESRLVEEGFFRRSALKNLLDEHQSGRVDHHHRLWMLLNLEVWFRHYIEGEGVEELSEELRNTAGASSERNGKKKKVTVGPATVAGSMAGPDTSGSAE